jgi:AraC-like DNA-binding protein
MIKKTASDEVPFATEGVDATESLFRDIEHRLERYPLFLFPVSHRSIRAHAHRFVELVYVSKGRGLHIHASQRYPVIAGDCYIVLPHETHGYEGGDNFAIVNFMFEPEMLAPHIRELRCIDGFEQFVAIEPFFRSETAFRYKLHLSSAQNAVVKSLVAQIYREQSTWGAGSEAMRSGLFLQLMAQLGRFFGENLPKSPAGDRHGDLATKQEMIERAVAYLEEHFAEDVSVRTVASHVCLSVSHFSHLFKEKTGMTLVDYLLGIRMDIARRLLRETNKNITEVAFEVGFHDAGYFTRLFRKHFGASPSAIRKSA